MSEIQLKFVDYTQQQPDDIVVQPILFHPVTWASN
jgi:hypothetical protein